MLLGVDVGGTFTDAVLVRADAETHTASALAGAEVHTAKVPSTPEDQSRGVLAAIASVLSQAAARAADVQRFAHGMTVATNALLEGRGARTTLVATEGFTDVVELARQARAHLYKLCDAQPAPLVPAALRFAAPERMGPDGPLLALTREHARALVERVAEVSPQAVAVVLLHSYAHPEHEQLLGELLGEQLPGVHVSLSHELVGTFREYERAATTEIDAALSPLLADYLRRLSEQAQATGLPEPEIMQSSGGLVDSAQAAAHAALTVLSGPAGGVGGALLLARAAGAEDVLCFDMGGTSCDVCLIDGARVGETAERAVAGRPLALPALDIDTVGAGGGSIAWRDAGGALRVGPRSAGAVPGPACYGLGGVQPTVTDANLLLGRLLDDAPLAGGLELDRAGAERAVAALARELGLSTLACAEGIVRVAEAEMLRALRVMTVERGLDPRRFALMPFGGAGPLHAAAMARELGIRRILCPRASGVLCALGLAAAAPRRDIARTVMLAGEAFTAERLAAERERLIALARARLLGARGGTPAEPQTGTASASTSSPRGPSPRASDENNDVRVRYELRYRGQSFELPVDEQDMHTCDAERAVLSPTALREAFAAAHEERYGYRDERAEVELVTIRVSVSGAAPSLRLAGSVGAPPERKRRAAIFDGRELQTECLLGELPEGTQLAGPAICALGEATLVVPPGWSGSVDEHGTIHLAEDSDSAPGADPRATAPPREPSSVGGPAR